MLLYKLLPSLTSLRGSACECLEVLGYRNNVSGLSKIPSSDRIVRCPGTRESVVKFFITKRTAKPFIQQQLGARGSQAVPASLSSLGRFCVTVNPLQNQPTFSGNEQRNGEVFVE
ncbi:hypothetical protein J6590_003382 [Homalodisca vitripennis]|nr:hypothetical protein J6590_003382 [Homalodisca vitripennis]